jgi:hypothetical protein
MALGHVEAQQDRAARRIAKRMRENALRLAAAETAAGPPKRRNALPTRS